MEAVVKKHARTAKHPWLVACDANMKPEGLNMSFWFKERRLCIEASGGGMSICRSKPSNGEVIERTHNHVIARRISHGKIKSMEVVEDFESRPHKAFIFLVERDKEDAKSLAQYAAEERCQGEAKPKEATK